MVWAMRYEKLVKQLEVDGIVVLPAVLSGPEVMELRCELESAIAEDMISRPGVFDRGMVHNCMVRGRRMAALLDNPAMNDFLKRAFAETCIMYAYQSSSLQPFSGNYGSRVHVDCPRFIPGYTTNVGVIFPLDDFTAENGATWYLKGSHRSPEIPGDEPFFAAASRACCTAGDMVVFNGRLVHAAGVNSTGRARHALTINICRSFMRQRFDFPRLVSKSLIDSLGPDGKRLIGMNVRMPTSLDEFYLSEDQRPYKPSQG